MKFIADLAGRNENRPMHFGKFLWELLGDLGISGSKLAKLANVDIRTVYRWKDAATPPRGDALTLLADVLGIPLPTLRAAATGAAKLPAEYRSRERWKSLGLEVAADGASAGAAVLIKVMDWYKAAPPAVQQVVLGEVPAGMEEDYLRHVTRYFSEQILGRPNAGSKAKPAANSRK